MNEIKVAADGFEVGFGRANITPSFPVPLGGYATRTQLVSAVDKPIWARAVVWKDASGALALMISLEVVGWSRILREGLCAWVLERYGIGGDACFLNATHTHSAPMVEGSIDNLVLSVEGFSEARSRYFRFLEERIKEAVEQAFSSLFPARMYFTQTQAGFAVNRRRTHPDCAHLPGPVDHDVPIIKIYDKANELKGILFGYACHTTVLNDDIIHGDWAGIAMESLEERHSGICALYLAGCGADQNPLPRRSKKLRDAYGMIMAEAISQAGEGIPLDGILTTRRSVVELPLQRLPQVEEIETLLEKAPPLYQFGYRNFLQQAKTPQGLADIVPLEIVVWQFGSNLCLIGMSGEIVVDYALRFKMSYGANSTWVCGYTGVLEAYIPSERVLAEGGYEAGESQFWFGWAAPFATGLEEKIIKTVEKLLLS